MKTTMQTHACQGGALLSVLILITTLTTILGSLYATSWQRLRMIRADSHIIRAMAIAEAGIQLTFDALQDDHTLPKDGTPVLTNTYASGNYSVSITEPLTGIYQLSATGTYREQTVQAGATVTFFNPGGSETNEIPGGPIGPFGPAALFAGGNLTFQGGVNAGMGDLGAHANGNLVLQGGPSVSGASLSTLGSLSLGGNPNIQLNGGLGQLHANGPVELKGTVNASLITSSTSITGNWGVNSSATNIAPVVTYPGWYSPMPPIEIQSVTPVEPLPMPDLDVDAFRNYAIGNTWFYTGNQNITRSWITKDVKDRTGNNVRNNQTVLIPEGGVMFVDGTVSIASDITIQGSVIATGNVRLTGAASINNPTDYPAIVSVNGDITVTGGSSMPNPSGWIYAMNGNVTASGGASGFGVIAAQDITITGGYSVGVFTGAPLLAPGQTPPTPGGGVIDPGVLQLLSWTH